LSQKKTKADLIEIRCTDLGLPRPGPYSSGISHIHRVVTGIQPIEGQRGQAETGEIRFGGKQVQVYRLCGRPGSWWSTNRASILEPIRAVSSLVRFPPLGEVAPSSGENRNA
jgi:hypothetical protein